MSGTDLPQDIVAVMSGPKSYLFYVDGDNKLSYLISPDTEDGGVGVTGSDPPSYTTGKVTVSGKDVHVASAVPQIAALGFTGTVNGVSTNRIHVYFAEPKKSQLTEVKCIVGSPWEYGSLGNSGVSNIVVPGSSLSATVHPGVKGREWNIRVFACIKDQKNEKRVQQISRFEPHYNGEVLTKSWDFVNITGQITTYDS